MLEKDNNIIVVGTTAIGLYYINIGKSTRQLNFTSKNDRRRDQVTNPGSLVYLPIVLHSTTPAYRDTEYITQLKFSSLQSHRYHNNVPAAYYVRYTVSD